MTRAKALLLALGLATPAATEAGDPARGEALFARCAACHQVGEGARHGAGPHLHALMGRRLGSLPDYARYSEGLTRAGADGLTWTPETLDAYLADPRSLVSDTRMNFPGLRDPADRADLIAWLATLSGTPAAAPATHPADLDPAILAIEGDPAYGEYLAGECTVCHQTDGDAAGIPSITGWPVEDFVIAMHAYRNNVRQNPTMNMMASRLSDEEIAALAAYFATLQ
jgi:cytochrome c